MTTDCELLCRYAETGDQAAFTEIVRLNVNLVYSAALRQVGGDAHHAQDVTQKVFAELARQARDLSGHASITGWLYTTTKFTACKLITGERRRLAREQEAFIMQETAQAPEPKWELLRTMLDEAVCELEAADREAVLMRYFQNKSHREVGDVLGVSEDTARKRVERALEKLRTHFAGRGVTVSSALLVTTMVENSVLAAPSGLAESVADSSLAGGAWTIGTGAAAGSAFLKFFLMHPKTTIILVGVVALTVAGAWHFYPSSSPKVVTAAVAKSAVVAPPPQVEAPVVAPVAVVALSAPKPADGPVVASQTTAAPDAPTVDPRNDLKTALQELARLERANDDFTALKEFTPPDSEKMKEVEVLLQQKETNDAQMEAMNPGFLEKMAELKKRQPVDQIRELNATAYEAAENQTPTFNATGDEATYIITLQPIQLRAGRDGRDGKILDGEQHPLTFIKINGKWYEKFVVDPNALPPPPPPGPPGPPGVRGN